MWLEGAHACPDTTSLPRGADPSEHISNGRRVLLLRSAPATLVKKGLLVHPACLPLACQGLAPAPRPGSEPPRSPLPFPVAAAARKFERGGDGNEEKPSKRSYPQTRPLSHLVLLPALPPPPVSSAAMSDALRLPDPVPPAPPPPEPMAVAPPTPPAPLSAAWRWCCCRPGRADLGLCEPPRGSAAAPPAEPLVFLRGGIAIGFGVGQVGRD